MFLFDVDPFKIGLQPQMESFQRVSEIKIRLWIENCQ
jgi:hypothetical protein